MIAKLFRHKILLLLILLLLGGLTWAVVRIMPASEEELRRSTCFVEGKAYLCLATQGDTIVLNADTVQQQGVWINKHWWWPSCNGRVLTIAKGHVALHRLHLNNPDSLKRVVAEGIDSLGRLLQRKDIERKELVYYLRSHGVIDEGYMQIAAYANAQKVETDSLTARYKRLKNIKSLDKVSLLYKGIYNVSWYDNDGKLQRVDCSPVITRLDDSGQPVILHTRRLLKPWGVYAVRNVMWGVARHKKIIVVSLSKTSKLTEHHAILITGDYEQGRNHDVPRLFAVDGSPVFTQHGRFLGVVCGKEVRQ